MGRTLLIPILMVVFILLVSCQVPLEQALENIQNPEVEVKTTLRVPVIATSVNVGEYISQTIADLEEELPGLEILEGSPILLRYATSAVIFRKDEFSGLLDDISGEMNFSVSIDAPNLQGFEESIEFDSPQLSSVYSTFRIPYLPPGEYTTPATSSDMNIGLTSSDLDSFTVSGSITISVELPDNWEDVSVVSISATITDGSGNVIYSGTVNGSSVDIDLSGKNFEVGNGKITVAYSLTFNSGSVHTEGGNVTVSIIPNISITSLKGLKANFSHAIPLPENVTDIEIESGRVVISANVDFTAITGTIEYEEGSKDLRVESGKIIADLSNVALPATVSIYSVDVNLSGDINSIDLSGSIESVVLKSVTIENEDLSVEGSQSIYLPEEAKLLKNVEIEAGQLVFEYDSKIPVDVNVHVYSPDFEPALDWSFTIASNTSGSVTYDLSGKSIALEGDTFDVQYSASPVGYDGENLTLNDVSLDQDFTLDATFSYGDISVSEVTVGGTEIEYEGSVDLSEYLGDLTDTVRILSYFDMSATLTSSVDMEGTITLDATTHKDDDSSPISLKIPVSGKEISLDSLVDALKDILVYAPERIDYSVGIEVDQLTVDLSTDLSFKLDAEVPLVAHFDEKTLVLTYATDVKVDLPEEGSVIEAATLLIEGTNTTGFTPTIEVYISDEKSAELDLSRNMEGYIAISGDDLEKLEDGLNVRFEVYLDGDQVISTEGLIYLISKLEADVRIATGGGE